MRSKIVLSLLLPCCAGALLLGAVRCSTAPPGPLQTRYALTLAAALLKSDQRDLAKRVDEWAARKAESLAMYKPKKKKARRESPSAVALALAVAEAAAAPKKLRKDPGGSEFVTPPSSPKRAAAAARVVEVG